ncbi:aldo/keto reductase [Litorilinea aerophila]|uniref:Aldo/keto reductase n=1 Tax=Litorilinea aerophila TaxID=1204385 RepID=A0A540VG59_9CHLR|nr:aldo/keto reductase [Litorilinea aerophila]MCC9076442.1 aldo/keto reductase [Litorilinea aerophila]OUC05449.1 aldo/keto reductase [Litorilinea aerophila]
MEYRILGKTGLRVSVLSYGASPLGSVFREVDEAEGIRTVHTALDLGINFIDVSPYYGLTRAETVLGKALRGIPRTQYVLATKVGRYGDQEFDFSAARVTASVEESLRRLNVPYIDLIQCHDIEFGDLDQVVNETIPALRRLQQQGKVRFIGITGLPLKIFRYVLERTDVDSILSYCRYALNNTQLVDLIPFLQEKQVGIINASPLSMGLLTNRGAPAWHPASEEIKQTCARAAAFCREQGVDIAKLALQFALANPDIHTTLVGTANPENIRKNVAWMEEPLDEELLAQVQQILAPIHNQIWLSGRPENN